MHPILRFTATAILVLLPVLSQAGEDAHDKLVYSRYSRAFQPTTYKPNRGEERVPLDHPATLEDVHAGREIFSFEGLGEARGWKPAVNNFSVA